MMKNMMYRGVKGKVMERDMRGNQEQAVMQERKNRCWKEVYTYARSES
jgi:hypothetical protein